MVETSIGTHFGPSDDNVKNLCRCSKVRTSPNGIFSVSNFSTVTATFCLYAKSLRLQGFARSVGIVCSARVCAKSIFTLLHCNCIFKLLSLGSRIASFCEHFSKTSTPQSLPRVSNKYGKAENKCWQYNNENKLQIYSIFNIILHRCVEIQRLMSSDCSLKMDYSTWQYLPLKIRLTH